MMTYNNLPKKDEDEKDLYIRTGYNLSLSIEDVQRLPMSDKDLKELISLNNKALSESINAGFVGVDMSMKDMSLLDENGLGEQLDEVINSQSVLNLYKANMILCAMANARGIHFDASLMRSLACLLGNFSFVKDTTPPGMRDRHHAMDNNARYSEGTQERFRK